MSDQETTPHTHSQQQEKLSLIHLKADMMIKASALNNENVTVVLTGSSVTNSLKILTNQRSVTIHLFSRLAVTGAGYSSGAWIHPRDYTGGLKPHE
jgi:hypothetical protein